MTARQTFTLPANILAAAAAFRPKESTRPTIAGVLIERSGPDACIVATDGSTLFAENYGAQHTHGPDADVVILADFHKIKPHSLVNDLAEIDIREDGDVRITVYPKRGAPLILAGRVSEYTFPHWRQCYPRESVREAVAGIGLDPSLAARFAAAFGLRASFTFHGEGRAVIVQSDSRPDAVGLWMPVRRKDGADVTLPSWLRERSDRPVSADVAAD